MNKYQILHSHKSNDNTWLHFIYDHDYYPNYYLSRFGDENPSEIELQNHLFHEKAHHPFNVSKDLTNLMSKNQNLVDFYKTCIERILK